MEDLLKMLKTRIVDEKNANDFFDQIGGMICENAHLKYLDTANITKLAVEIKKFNKC